VYERERERERERGGEGWQSVPSEPGLQDECWMPPVNTSLMSLSGESKWSALISSQIPLTSANVCVRAHDIFMDDRWSPQHHWMRERECVKHTFKLTEY